MVWVPLWLGGPGCAPCLQVIKGYQKFSATPKYMVGWHRAALHDASWAQPGG
jgi:hypothetical protein